MLVPSKRDLSPIPFLTAFYITLFLANLFMALDVYADSPPVLIDFHQTVLPILKTSCFACHVPNATAPYAGTDPVIDTKIKKEIADALEDFTMGDRFPFPADEPTAKQLKHLEKELSKGFMPPDEQAKLGLGSAVSDKNRKILLDWVIWQRALQK